MNAVEQLQSIDDLTRCRAALHAKMLREATRIITGFRLPGEWTPDRLHTAHLLARDILEALEGYKNSNDMKNIITRRVSPLVEMGVRK